MPLTKEFSETVKARAQRDPEFRRGLMKEAVNAFLSGEPALGRALIRNYINATVGFQNLAARTKIGDKSLMRMFAPGGNPSMQNVSMVLKTLQDEEAVTFAVEEAASKQKITVRAKRRRQGAKGKRTTKISRKRARRSQSSSSM